MPSRRRSESDLEHASLLEPSVIQLRDLSDIEKGDCDDEHKRVERHDCRRRFPLLSLVPPRLQTALSYLSIVFAFFWIVAECVDNDIAACALSNPELPALILTGCWWWLASAAFFMLYWRERGHWVPLGIAVFMMVVGWTVFFVCLFTRLRAFGYVEGGWRMMAVA